MFENERIGKVDTSEIDKFFKKYGLNQEQAAGHEEDEEKRTERIEDANKC